MLLISSCIYGLCSEQLSMACKALASWLFQRKTGTKLAQSRSHGLYRHCVPFEPKFDSQAESLSILFFLSAHVMELMGKGLWGWENFFHSPCFSCTNPLTAMASISVSPWENPIHTLTIWWYFIMLFVWPFPNLGDSRDNFSPCSLKYLLWAFFFHSPGF